MGLLNPVLRSLSLSLSFSWPAVCSAPPPARPPIPFRTIPRSPFALAAAQVAAHDAPVRQLAWCQQLNMLITGSWDKTLRYWDTRSPSAAFSYQLPERLYAMSERP